MRTLLVDGDSVMVRACRAVRRRGLAPQDEAAVFLNSLLFHLRRERPDAVMVGWDSGGFLWRQKMYPGYKGSRRGAGAENRVREVSRVVLEAMGIPQDTFPACEGDDVVAAYSRPAAESGEAVIVSGDQDLLQLCRGTVIMRLIRSATDADLWDSGRVRDQVGCPPQWLPALSALAGDRSDRIPGIRGIGPARALRMLRDSGGSISAIRFDNDADRESAMRWLALADLTGEIASSHHRELREITSFSPAGSDGGPDSGQLEQVLARYGMTALLAALRSGALWPQPVRSD